MTLLYIAGPMTGLPYWNYPAFNTAEAQLQAKGYQTHNPVRSSEGRLIPPKPRPRCWEDYMRNGLNQVIRCDGIALLPGWEESRGARIEARVGMDLGLRIAHLDTWILAGLGGPEPTELVLTDLEHQEPTA